MTAPTIPLILTEEAAAEVTRLGMQRELELMIDWVRRNVPGLRTIRVTLGRTFLAPALGPRIVIWAHRKVPADESTLHLADWDWGGWKAQTFPPHVCVRFTMISAFYPVPAA